MIKESKSALIVGATGLVGKELLRNLLERPDYNKVIVFTRTPTKIDHPKLEEIFVNFNNLFEYKEFMNVSDVFCCLGTTIKNAGSQDAFRKVDYEYPLVLAKLAKECDVNRFLIISAMGANKNSKVFYNRVKGEIEEELSRIGFLTLQIFRPSLLLGERKEFRLGEKIASGLTTVLSFAFVGGLRKYKPIQAKDVANSMYFAAQMPVIGKKIYLSDEIMDLELFKMTNNH